MKSRVRDALPGSPKSHDHHIKAQGYDEWHWHITPCPASLSQKCRLLKPEGLTSFLLENRVVWPAGKGSRWPTNVPLNSTAVTCQKHAVNHFPVSSSGIFFLAKTKILGEPGRSSWLCCSFRLGSAERHSPGLTLVPAQAGAQPHTIRLGLKPSWPPKAMLPALPQMKEAPVWGVWHEQLSLCTKYLFLLLSCSVMVTHPHWVQGCGFYHKIAPENPLAKTNQSCTHPPPSERLLPSFI